MDRQTEAQRGKIVKERQSLMTAVLFVILLGLILRPLSDFIAL